MRIKDFKGDCKGIRLEQRAPNDLHIIMKVLTEDDGNWFVDEGHGFSSSWCDDLIEQIEDAQRWMKKHGVPDIAKNNRQYGWKFPEN